MNIGQVNKYFQHFTDINIKNKDIDNGILSNHSDKNI